MSGSPRPSLGPGHTFRSRPVCGPYGRETARMRTGLRPQSAARVMQVRRARYHLLPTCVSPAVPSRASPSLRVALPSLTVLLSFLYVALPESSLYSCGNSGLFMSPFRPTPSKCLTRS